MSIELSVGVVILIVVGVLLVLGLGLFIGATYMANAALQGVVEIVTSGEKSRKK